VEVADAVGVLVVVAGTVEVVVEAVVEAGAIVVAGS